MARIKAKSKASRSKVKPKSTAAAKLRAAEQRLKKQQAEVNRLKKAVAKPAPKTKLVKSRKAKPAPKTKRAKLVKSKPAPKASTRNLTDLQKQFLKLQQLGLTNSRKQPRNVTSKDKPIVNAVKKFKDVISGKAKSYKVTKDQAKSYKKIGVKVVDNIAVVPKTAVKKLRNGEVRTISLPINYKNLPEFFNSLENDKNLERFRPEGASWAFKFYGHDSHGTYPTLQALQTFLSHYKSIVGANTKAKKKDILDHIQIVTVKRTTWHKRKKL